MGLAVASFGWIVRASTGIESLQNAVQVTFSTETGVSTSPHTLTVLERIVAVFSAALLFITLFAAIYQIISNTLSLPSLPGFKYLENSEGYFIVDENGRHLNAGVKKSLRGLLTYGLLYFTLFSIGSAGKSPIFGITTILGLLYFVISLFYLESNAKYRALHDTLLGLWKVKVDDDSNWISKNEPIQIDKIKKLDTISESLV